MITTYQLARKNFYKASSKFVKLKTDKIANAVLRTQWMVLIKPIYFRITELLRYLKNGGNCEYQILLELKPYNYNISAIQNQFLRLLISKNREVNKFERQI